MMVVWAIERLGSDIISTKSRKLSLKRRYHLTSQHDDLTIKVATLEQFIQIQEPSHLSAFNPSGR